MHRIPSFHFRCLLGPISRQSLITNSHCTARCLLLWALRARAPRRSTAGRRTWAYIPCIHPRSALRPHRVREAHAMCTHAAQVREPCDGARAAWGCTYGAGACPRARWVRVLVRARPRACSARGIFGSSGVVRARGACVCLGRWAAACRRRIPHVCPSAGALFSDRAAYARELLCVTMRALCSRYLIFARIPFISCFSVLSPHFCLHV